jgi:septum formation topological specificity factor MinE
LTNKYQKCDNNTVIITTNKGEKMTVAVATYKVGDTYTTQKSKVTGVIKEIVPTDKNTVRVKLDVNGSIRWTTWKSK